MGVTVIPKPPLPCLLPALERGETSWQWGSSWAMLEPGHPMGAAPWVTAQGHCDALAGPVSLPWIRVPDRNHLLLFPEVQTGTKKWHPVKTWSGGVRRRFGTQCPALLLPPLCCVHGETSPGCCWASGLPIPADFLWDCLWRHLQEPQTSDTMSPPHIPTGATREGTNMGVPQR